MAHKVSVKSGERGVVTFLYNAVELAVFLLCALVGKLDSKAIKGVKVVAGYYRARFKSLEIFHSLDVGYDHLLFVNYFI